VKQDTLEYSRLLEENKIAMTYVGPLWPEGIDGLAEMLKKRLDSENMTLSASQAIFSVFVEMANNMLMYSVDDRNIFILGKHGKRFFLQTGNAMRISSVEFLKSRLEQLNSMSKSELRAFLKEQRREKNTNPESKGGGIGLIEVARRSYSKIEYEFTELGGEVAHFSVYVVV